MSDSCALSDSSKLAPSGWPCGGRRKEPGSPLSDSCVLSDSSHSGSPCGGCRKELVVRMMHFSGRSRFVLHEGATLMDLMEKVRISTGVIENQQKLACDANGLTSILAADAAPLSSVGLSHGNVFFLYNTVTASSSVSGSSHGARPVNVFSRRDSRRPCQCRPVPPRSGTHLPALSCRHLCRHGVHRHAWHHVFC